METFHGDIQAYKDGGYRFAIAWIESLFESESFIWALNQSDMIRMTSGAEYLYLISKEGVHIAEYTRC